MYYWPKNSEHKETRLPLKTLAEYEEFIKTLPPKEKTGGGNDIVLPEIPDTSTKVEDGEVDSPADDILPEIAEAFNA